MTSDLPRPSLPLVIGTQAILGILFLAGLAAIALLPSLSTSVATSLPEYAQLRGPLLAITIALTLLGLIALTMVALLVHRIYAETMLTRPSLLWIDVIVVVLACGALLDIAGSITISNAQAGNPLLALVQTTALLTLAALACITLVLRSLLRSAIEIRAELDEVV